jgi:gamma-glutamyl phosphate reductase
MQQKIFVLSKELDEAKKQLDLTIQNQASPSRQKIREANTNLKKIQSSVKNIIDKLIMRGEKIEKIVKETDEWTNLESPFNKFSEQRKIARKKWWSSLSLFACLPKLGGSHKDQELEEEGLLEEYKQNNRA